MGFALATIQTDPVKFIATAFRLVMAFPFYSFVASQKTSAVKQCPRFTMLSRVYFTHIMTAHSRIRALAGGVAGATDLVTQVQIGVTGFEPAASWSQTTRSTKLSYTPYM
jgi:hypothetical protein